jgi:Protein of unknown function (DUF4019)
LKTNTNNSANKNTNAMRHPASALPSWEIILAFCFGVIFVTTILVTTLFKPDPTAYQYTVFRIVLSLAAGGVGAVLPGFIEVKYREVVRAGGALALFLVVFFGAPAALSPVIKEPQEISENSQPAIEKWFSAMDTGKLAEAYKQTSLRFQNQYTYKQFEHLANQYVIPLGIVERRTLNGTSFAQSPPGAPAGRFQYNVYETKYSRSKKPLYFSTTVIGENNEWRVFGFTLAIKNDQGILIPFDPSALALAQ